MARPLRIFVICPVFGVDAERQTVESAIQDIPLSTPPEVHFSYSVPIPIPISYEEEVRSSNIILLLLTEAPSQVLRSEVACVRLPSGRLFALVSESASREAVAFVQESAAIHTRFVDTEDLKLKVVRVVSEELIAGYKQYRLPAADLTPIAALCERVEAESGQSDIAQPSPRRADIYSGASAAGPGAAFVGSENLVITGSVGGNVVINRDKVNSNASADEKSGAIPYLRLVCHVTGNLPLRGADVIGSGPDSSQRPFHLTQLFIDLDASPVVSSGGRNRSPQLSSQRPRAVSVTQVAATHPKLVLLGAPGVGKSTVVNYLAHCLGTYTLRPELYWLESRLPGWPRDCSVPIVVPLRDFTRWIVRNQSDTGRADVYHLWKFIEDRLKQQRLHAADGFLHDALDNGQASSPSRWSG